MEVNAKYFTIKYYKRIKLLNEAAFDLADVSLPYYAHNNTERITAIKARITLPDNTTIDLSKNDFFDTNINTFLKAKKFIFPKVVKGAILEYEYTVKSTNTFQLRDFYFQEKHPVWRCKLTFALEEPMKYAIILQEKEQGNILRKDETNKIIYTAFQVPAFKEEPYVTSYDNYYVKIMFQLSFYQRAYLSDWKKLASSLKHKSFFGQQYLKKRNYKKALADVQPLLTNVFDPKEKTKIIYNYLNEVLHWNGTYDPFVSTSLGDVYESKTGTSGELNLLLVALLKEVGLTADPVLISTRSKGRAIQLYPIVDQFNHTIVQVKLGEENWLLDLSDKYRSVNYIRTEALNYSGWLVRDKQPEWIDIKAPYSTEVYEGDFTLDKNGGLVGNLNIKQKGYSAFASKKLIEEKSIEAVWQKQLEENSSDLEINNISYKDELATKDMMELNIECSVPNASMQVSDLIYLSPMAYSPWMDNLFKSPKRLYSVDFAFPTREQYSYTIHLPAGYGIEELPQSVKFRLPDGEAHFSYLVTQVDDTTIKISNRLYLKEVYFPPNKYEDLKLFFDEVATKLQEPIVLKKLEQSTK